MFSKTMQITNWYFTEQILTSKIHFLKYLETGFHQFKKSFI